MEFEAKVFSLPPMATINTQRGEMQRQDVIFEFPGDFARKICVEFWNERATRASALKEGESVVITFRVDSREYNGRWYTRATGLGIDYPRVASPAFDPYTNPTQQVPKGEQSYPNYAAAPSATVESEPQGASDDLPF